LTPVSEATHYIKVR